MYKTVAEVESVLAQRIADDKVKSRQGRGGTFSYIAWNDTSRALDDVFGPFGWSEKVVGQHSDSRLGVYSVTREITGYAVDTDGSVRAITRTAVGRAVISGDTLADHDTAMAAADSDSFSRAAKKLGDAFGLFLYEKDGPATTSSYKAAPKSSGGSKGDDIRPSEKQLGVLTRNGYTEDEIDDMPFKQWKALLDDMFAAMKAGDKYVRPGKGKATAKKAAKPADDDEDEEGLPF